MTTEEKFNAAVNVIRSLPKNGSYQPSNELMLRFYAYYKQATLGPNNGRRPAFYDVVGRAKYDAWKSLGEMPKSVAMSKYIDELHSIVETMSYSDKVANFLEAPTDSHELETVSWDDLELVASDVMERFRSHPNSPFASREASPTRLNGSSGESLSPSPPLNAESDHSDDEYIDTIEYPESKKAQLNNTSSSALAVNSTDHQVIQNGDIPSIHKDQHQQQQHVSRSRTKSHLSSVDVSQEISSAVQNLRTDLERLTNKINSMEKLQKSSSGALDRRSSSSKFFGGVSLQMLAFIIAWPFLASFIMNRFVLRNNNNFRRNH